MKRLTTMIAAGLVTTGPAFADKLDGDWCNPQDGKLTINGTIITPPAGNRVEGTYSRHRFDYTAPADGWNGGKAIVIQQFSDELMELSVDGGTPAQWKPCDAVTS